MLRKLRYISIIIIALVFVGCDNFLDIQPIGKVIPKTGKEFRGLLTEAYNSIPDNRGMTTFRTDEMVMNAANSSTTDLDSFFDIWTWNDVNPAQGTFSFGWRNYYYTLFIANYVIENQANITEATPFEIEQLVGESYMLRAYCHFLLANLYGEPYNKAADVTTSKAVPLKLSSDVEEIPFRDTLDKIYESILSDLEQAESYINIENWDLGYNYRFNKLSVDAFRSRVLLYMGEWSESLIASQKVLEVKPALSDLNSELPNHYTSVESIVALEEIMTSNYINAGGVDRNFYRKYESGDLRSKTYFRAVSASNISLLKGGSIQFRCTFRTGEIYLNAAEAAANMGSLEEARTYLLALDKMRYSESTYTEKVADIQAMSQDELLMEIYDERARELAFEGHRWFDLRRTTQPRIEKAYGTEKYMLEENDPRYTLRIPSEAIEANPNLTL